MRPQPGTLTLTFNFTLSETSKVAIEKDDKAVALAKPSFTSNKLAMSVAVPAGTGSGCMWWTTRPAGPTIPVTTVSLA